MEKYVKEIKKEDKKANFFSSVNPTAVAIDINGSTWDDVIQNQKNNFKYFIWDKL